MKHLFVLSTKGKYHIDSTKDKKIFFKKIDWYYALILLCFWIMIYLIINVKFINILPQPFDYNNELIKSNDEVFIAERAYNILNNLTNIGPRVVGSIANEIVTIKFLKEQIFHIFNETNNVYEFELDIQMANGSFIHWSMLNVYKYIQNVIVRLRVKNTTSTNYILINSHYDSVPGSLGIGDDGSMVAIMLEIMYVLSKMKKTYLRHPIIFLFNGAEENPLQGSHAFITQHKWARNCKILINLDAAGSSGREILFQTSPNYPWLMNYYSKVPHPFATSVAEELFQADLIPSDTDFHIFRDYGQLPGYDMAYIFNGYVYHTPYDYTDNNIKCMLQNTGDNVLSLVKNLANANELDDMEEISRGHMIYYDILGLFIITYSNTVEIITNLLICMIAFLVILLSLYLISNNDSCNFQLILLRFSILCGIQTLALLFGIILTLLMAIFMEIINRSMSWYYHQWLIIGLFFCPMFFAMGIVPAYYFHKNEEKKRKIFFDIQLLQHAHCILLICLTIIFTYIGIRSAYVFMLSIFFYVIGVSINILMKSYNYIKRFLLLTTISQLPSFIYDTYLMHNLYIAMIPMMGRSGSNLNSDLFISIIAITSSILFAGFLIPLLLLFRKVIFIFCTFFGITVIFVILTLTPLGFPYKSQVAGQRLSLIHVHRILRDDNNNIRFQESGIYMQIEDRNPHNVDVYIRDMHWVKYRLTDLCKKEMFYGLPIYNHRWHKYIDYSFWIPIGEQPNIPGIAPNLKLKSIVDFYTSNKKRYKFILSGPDHMNLFIRTISKDVQIYNWSFNNQMLQENWTQPYFIYLSYGKRNTPLIFSIDLESSQDFINHTSLEIGIGGHWTHQKQFPTDKYQKFLKSLPNFFSLTTWVATYETWIF